MQIGFSQLFFRVMAYKLTMFEAEVIKFRFGCGVVMLGRT